MKKNRNTDNYMFYFIKFLTHNDIKIKKVMFYRRTILQKSSFKLGVLSNIDGFITIYKEIYHLIK